MSEEVKKVMLKLTMRMQETKAAIASQITTEVEEKVDQKELDEESTSPSKAKTMTTKKFVDVTLARMNGIKLKSMEKLKNIEEVNNKKELSELKNKPEISKASQKLGKRDNKVYDRVEKDSTESKKALERIKEKLDKERNEKIDPELTFKPKLIKPGKKPVRSKAEYFEYNMRWMEKTKKKKEMKKEEIEGKLKVDLKFTPGIDNNSLNIVQGLGARKKIEERLLEKSEFNKRKLQALREEQNFTFIPVIEENSRAIAKHKVDGQVFDRLFHSGKRDSTPNNKSTKVQTMLNRSFSFSNDLEDHKNKLDFLLDVTD